LTTLRQICRSVLVQPRVCGHDAPMSLDIFLQGFRGGEAEPGNGDAAMKLITPLISERADGWARVVTNDGEADVFGIDQPSAGLMFNHVSGVAAWSLLFDVARVAGFTVMAVGCPSCVVSADMLRELPPELVADAIVISSGDDLLAAVENA
jgi:hypothetical protein